jgi:type III pantothenate kinase
MSTLLLVDVGNTRLKWALSRDGKRVAGGAIAHRGEPRPDLAPLLAQASGIEAVVAASVAPAALLDQLTAMLRDAGVHRPVHQPRVVREMAGLTAAYPKLENLGVDRWLAMLGASRRVGFPCVVADLGTAVTVDAVATDGQHLGGAILPGRHLQRDSLLSSTARIRHGDAGPATSTVFATDTGAAVAAGVDHAIASLIRRARMTLATAAGEPKVALVVTGGDADDMRALLPSDTCFEPELVLLGLQIWWETQRA